MQVGDVISRGDQETRRAHAIAALNAAPTASSSPGVPSSQVLPPLERSILLTVLYADLFDYALTRAELLERLIGTTASPARVEAATCRLCARYLFTEGEFVVWKGREGLIELRHVRRRAASGLWEGARRYGTWLARLPFVRMVAVSGSLALENAEPESDVDLFCITEANRLWLARLFIVPLSRLTRLFPARFPLYLCPNYILSTSALGVPDRNLFTAHEVTQAVPLWGRHTFRSFLAANAWVAEYLPHRSRRRSSADRLLASSRPVLARALEKLLRGPVGDALNRLVHGLFVSFYRRRAERAGWNWAALAPAYERERYTVPEGGYVRVVQRLYERQVRDRLGAAVPASYMRALFPESCSGGPAGSEWDELFLRDYGSMRSGGACASFDAFDSVDSAP